MAWNGGETPDGAVFQVGFQFLRREIERLWRRGLVDSLAKGAVFCGGGAGLEMLTDLIPAGFGGILHQMLKRYRRAGEVMEKCLHFLMEKRCPMLHALMFPSCADGFIERIIQPGGTEHLAIIPAKAGDGLFIERGLCGGREFNPLDALDSALAFNHETAGAFQHIAEEIQPHRGFGPWREDINDPAPKREITRLSHSGCTVETGAAEIIGQRLHIHPRPDRGRPASALHRGEGRDAERGGIYRGEDDGRSIETIRQCRESRHSLRADFGIGGDTIIGRAIPCREAQHGKVRREKGKRIGHCRRAPVIPRNMQHRPAMLPCEIGNDLAIIPFGRAADAKIGDGKRAVFH